MAQALGAPMLERFHCTGNCGSFGMTVAPAQGWIRADTMRAEKTMKVRKEDVAGRDVDGLAAFVLVDWVPNASFVTDDFIPSAHAAFALATRQKRGRFYRRGWSPASSAPTSRSMTRNR